MIVFIITVNKIIDSVNNYNHDIYLYIIIYTVMY